MITDFYYSQCWKMDNLEEPNDKRDNNLPTEEQIDELLANYNYSSEEREREEYEYATGIYNDGDFDFYNSGKQK